MDHLCFCACVSPAFASIHCCFVITCWGRADLLALVGDVYCIFDTFPCGILGLVWYLIVSIPDLAVFLTLLPYNIHNGPSSPDFTLSFNFMENGIYL